MRKYVFIIFAVFAAGIFLSGCTWNLSSLGVWKEEPTNTGVPEDPTNSPLVINKTFEAERSGGCGNFFVYIGDSDDLFYITAQGDGDILENGTYDLSKSNLSVSLNIFSPSMREVEGEFPYCNDVAPFKEAIEYKAKSGLVTVEKKEPVVQDSFFDNYDISLHLKDVVFETNGEDLKLENLDIEDISVGWYPG